MFLFSLFIFNKISSFLTLISQLFVFFPNLFIKLYLCLIQNGLSLKLLTYRLCFGFFSSLSFMKIWNLMRFRHLWIIYIYIYFFFFFVYKYYHTFTYFVIEKCSNSKLRWTNTINFYIYKNRRTSALALAQSLVFKYMVAMCSS